MSENDSSSEQLERDIVSATFYCALCGSAASTVYYLPPGADDPRFDPEPAGVPPGVGTIGQPSGRISIEGGPVSVTISVAGDSAEAAIPALRSRDPEKLWIVDREFTPFWCFRCGKSYCDAHWRSGARYDDGFFDCIEGTCPKEHRQTLMD